MSTPNLSIPIVDFSGSYRASTVRSIRNACAEYGFFYLINHGIDGTVTGSLFRESKKFFDLPLSDKMDLGRDKTHRGYIPSYGEKLDTTDSKLKGDLKESFSIGHIQDPNLSKWPSKSKGILPAWREAMELFYENAMNVGTTLFSLIALALNLDENYFNKIGAMDSPRGFLRVMHYPGEISESDKGQYGTSAHTDFGLIALLVTDGVPGLQMCRKKDSHPRMWEDVPHVEGAIIVIVGDMMERWTNCTFRSLLHQVVVVGEERYSASFFLHPSYDCVVKCLESCCSETSPPRFPPIKSGEYFRECLRGAYSNYNGMQQE